MGDTTAEERKVRGAWYTPPELVDIVVGNALEGFRAPDGDAVRILDPACGDGRFLRATAERLALAGHHVELTGCDIDAAALAAADAHGARLLRADALDHDWSGECFDIVVGNPPFLSQMASATTRGGSSRHGGGPYAGAAVEFLSLAVSLARPDGGRVALVLPQSVLGARDTATVRSHVDELADLQWAWWEPRQRHFDAAVNVCAIGLQRPSTGRVDPSAWTRIITDRLGVPALDPSLLHTRGTLGDRAETNANFRDEYYALVPAVADDADGPPLVTSGLIDPGQCHWGERTVRFAKRDFEHPRVDLSLLTGRFPAWAERKLVPKVLVANQTTIIEAVADPTGAWIPGVPVTTATPTGDATVWEIAAVLTSPIASIIAWQHGAGTGLSTTSVRVGPTSLADTPWPTGSLDAAVTVLRNGDLAACGEAVTRAYDVDPSALDTHMSWWLERLPDALGTGDRRH